MFTLLVWGINMCAPVHAQNKLDSLDQRKNLRDSYITHKF